MNFSSILSFISAFFAITLAIGVLYRDRRLFIHRVFATGMVLFALEAFLGGTILQSEVSEKVIFWYRVQLIITGLLNGVWLLFSMNFARGDEPFSFRKNGWVVTLSFVVPLFFVIFFHKSFFSENPILYHSPYWMIRLGWSGHLFYLSSLLLGIMILMNLERTLRWSIGLQRQQIKYLIFGLGSVFALRFYIQSTYLLFKSIDTSYEVLRGGALIAGGIIMIPSFLRMRILNLNLYLSQSFLYGSFTILIAGAYLISIGLLAKLISYLNGGGAIQFKIFVIFIALIGLCILLFSDRWRVRVKKFIHHHFKRPHYDYRREWHEFTRRMASLVEIRDLSQCIAKYLSETLEILSVTVWLYDEKKDCLFVGGSTAFSQDEKKEIKLSSSNEVRALIHFIKEQGLPLDVKDKGKNLKVLDFDFWDRMKIRWIVPMKAGEKFIGLIALHERISGFSMSSEDFNLLKTISDQAAASFLSYHLFDEIKKAKEMDAFQTMATFVLHDLKNLASTLSLTMKNLPVHFDNPEFRKDAIEVISSGVAQIQKICRELSLLSRKLEIKPVEVDLNQLVENTLSTLNGLGALRKILQPLPMLHLDPEQIQKVITNLILNAREATKGTDGIEVRTEQDGSWILLSIADEGCGMSKEFIEQSLFKPFRTTKKYGMGIGLFHSKMIVEAHGGRIEVESEEGKGSTFRVMLPLKENRLER